MSSGQKGGNIYWRISDCKRCDCWAQQLLKEIQIIMTCIYVQCMN